ncbi:MAG: transposase [Lachnospiraceae bacterium]|nr:transposase [Lachnospiraceae bacterium]
MPRKASGALKTGITRERQKNGDVYIYERKTKYDPIRKYSVTISKTLIGKIVKNTEEMVETRPKRRVIDPMIIEVDATPEISRRHVGMLDIVNHVSEKSGVSAEVNRAAGSDKGIVRKILTLVWYDFATDGETWPGLVPWTTKYAGLLPYRESPISQDMYHDLFVYLGRNESIKQSVFRHRAEMMGDGELLALDSTTIFTESENLNVGRSAPHKDKLIKNVYKVVEIYSITSRQPVAYARIPGNISDGTTVENALKQLDVLECPKVEIVADSGYSAESNMTMMIRNGYPFIMHVPTDTKWIQPLIEEHRDRLMNGGEIIHCDPKFSGITVMQMHDFAYERQRANKKSGLEKGETEVLSRRVYVHIYFSSMKKAEEDIKFRMQFDAVKTDILSDAYLSSEDQKFAEQYMNISYWGERITGVEVNTKAYKKRCRYHGFVVLVAQKEKDTNTALEKYRSREYVEEDFKNSKSYTGGNHPRVWDDDTLDGQMLVQFLAQSMHESFATMLRSLRDSLAIPNGDIEHDTSDKLKEEKQLKNWIRKTSMHNILSWFDAIEETRVSGKKAWRTERTKRDKLFVEKLGIRARG